MTGRRRNPNNQISRIRLLFLKRYIKQYMKTNLMKKRIRMMWCRWRLKLTKKTSTMIRYSSPEITSSVTFYSLVAPYPMR